MATVKQVTDAVDGAPFINIAGEQARPTWQRSN